MIKVEKAPATVKPNAVSRSVEVSVPEIGKVTIISGANELEFDVAGQTVKFVRESLKHVLNIDDDAKTLINGEEIKETTILTPNATLEFIKSSGTKG